MDTTNSALGCAVEVRYDSILRLSVEIMMNQPIIKAFVCFIFLLLTSNGAMAKLKVVVAVSYDDEKIRQELESSINARINSTERYTLANLKDSGVDLLLDVECLKVLKVVATVCTSRVSYWPFKDIALYVEVAAAVTTVSGPTEYVVNGIMNTFINGTTDDKLKATKMSVQAAILNLCYEQPSECKVPGKGQ